MPSAICVCSVFLVKRRTLGFCWSLRAGVKRGRAAAGKRGRIARDGPDDLAMLQPSRRDDQDIAGHVILAQVAEQVGARHRIQRLLRAGDGPAERLVRPERGVEQFLDVMLRLVQVHRHFLFDDLALLGDLHRVEPRVEQHIQQHIEQFVEAVVAGPGMETGHLLAGEGVQVPADALDRLGDLLGRALLRAFEQQVLDEMADAVERGRLVARPHADPQADAHTQHVRHLRRGDRQTVLELSDLIHDWTNLMVPGRIVQPQQG